MRKTILLLLAIIPCLCAAQRLVDHEENGVRNVMAEPIFGGDVRYPGCWSLGLCGYTSKVEKGTVYVIQVGVSGVNSSLFPKNPGILFKTCDEQTIKMKVEEVVDFPTKGYDDKNYKAGFYIKCDAAAMVKFNKGIKKIRIEMKEDYIEHNIDDLAIQSYIYIAYVVIKDRLSRPRKSFEEGF